MPFKKEIIQWNLGDAKFQKWSLKQHVEKVHEGKRCECHICDQEFPYRASLKIQIDAVHEEKIFDSKVCDRSFTQKPNLKRHIVSILGGERESLQLHNL